MAATPGGPLIVASSRPAEKFGFVPAESLGPTFALATRLLQTILLPWYHGLVNQQRLKRAVGNWVCGESFWDRQRELELLIEYLDDGAQVLLVGQRRIGNTSLMREAARRIDDRYLCLHVDLQQAHSAADAVAELSAATHPHAPLWAKTKSVFANILTGIAGRIDSLSVEDLRVTLRGALTGSEWQAKGDRVMEILAGAGKPVVLFIDEVPLLICEMLKGSEYQITPERRDHANAFLSWLRANGIRHKGRVRVVLSGSIGLEPIVRQAGLSGTLGYLMPFELGPWSHDTAAGCLTALANQYQVEFLPGTIDGMLDLIGVAIPHYVEMFFDHVYWACSLEGWQQVSKEHVAAVYERSMLSARGHAELSQLEERLKVVLGPELHPLALDLLSEAALSGRLTRQAAEVLSCEYLVAGAPSGEVLREILGILEHDGYLRQEEADAYVFVSKLLKDWWAARFRFAFVPAGRRKPAGAKPRFGFLPAAGGTEAEG